MYALCYFSLQFFSISQASAAVSDGDEHMPRLKDHLGVFNFHGPSADHSSSNRLQSVSIMSSKGKRLVTRFQKLLMV